MGAPHYIPSTLDEAIATLEADSTLAAAAVRGDVAAMHHSLGRQLRNDWNLWFNGTPLSDWFSSIGIHHGDDRSGIILESFQRKMSGQDIDLDGQIKWYLDFWKQSGHTPKAPETK